MGVHGEKFFMLPQGTPQFKNTEEIRSAVADHAFNTGHSIDWDNARMIDSCRHFHTQLLLES